MTNSVSKVQRLEERSCGLFVVDLQEKFAPVIQDWDLVVKASTRLIRFFQMLQAPIIVTEQYPKGLGATVAAIREVLGEAQTKIIAKTSFSSCGSSELKQVLEKHQRKQWIVCGIETHVCVQQTVLDLLVLSCEVFIAVDAVGSRHPIDRQVALPRMARTGAILSTSESLIFEILCDSKHPLFKQASALVK